MTLHLIQRKVRLLQRPSRMCILTSSSWPHKPRWPVEQSSSEAQQLFPWRETLFSRTPTNYSLTSLRPFLKRLQCIPPLPRYLKLHSLLSAILFFCITPIMVRETIITQSCLTLCGSMDCSLPGSSTHGISQARILQWVAMPSSQMSSPPRDGTWVSCISCIDRWVLYH